MHCPICDAPTEEDSYINTVMKNGEPQEEHASGVFCSNLDCEHNGEPIDVVEDEEEYAYDEL